MSDGGDPACWADRVCPACGMLDERPPGERDGSCPHCGRADDPHPTGPRDDAGTTPTEGRAAVGHRSDDPGPSGSPAGR